MSSKKEKKLFTKRLVQELNRRINQVKREGKRG